MRKSFRILLGGIFLFAIITCVTMNLDYDADGADQYGFPFNFYNKVSGYNEVTKQSGTSTEFDILSFTGDLALALLLSWLITLIYNKLRHKGSTTR